MHQFEGVYENRSLDWTRQKYYENVQKRDVQMKFKMFTNRVGQSIQAAELSTVMDEARLKETILAAGAIYRFQGAERENFQRKMAQGSQGHLCISLAASTNSWST